MCVAAIAPSALIGDRRGRDIVHRRSERGGSASDETSNATDGESRRRRTRRRVKPRDALEAFRRRDADRPPRPPTSNRPPSLSRKNSKDFGLRADLPPLPLPSPPPPSPLARHQRPVRPARTRTPPPPRSERPVGPSSRAVLARRLRRVVVVPACLARRARLRHLRLPVSAGFERRRRRRPRQRAPRMPGSRRVCRFSTTLAAVILASCAALPPRVRRPRRLLRSLASFARRVSSRPPRPAPVGRQPPPPPSPGHAAVPSLATRRQFGSRVNSRAKRASARPRASRTLSDALTRASRTSSLHLRVERRARRPDRIATALVLAVSSLGSFQRDAVPRVP